MNARGLALPRLGYGAASAVFLAGALAALLFADIAVTALDPWAELQRLIGGLISPRFRRDGGVSVVWTVAFAVLGVALGRAPVCHWRCCSTGSRGAPARRVPALGA